MAEQIDLTRHMYIARGGFAAPFFSWLGVFILVMLFYTFTASAPMLGDIVWQDAAKFATGWWSTAFGGRTLVGESVFSLMPLTVTLLVTYANYHVFRRRGIADWWEFGAAVASQVIAVLALCLIGRAQGDWWLALIGGGFLGAIAAALAGRERLFFTRSWWSHIDHARPRAKWLLRFIALLALVTTLVALVAGWSQIRAIHGYYLTGIAGTIGLILIQLAYAPTYVVWGLAWLMGPGFKVGEASRFSSLGVDAAPLPAIPVLGALPSPSFSAPWILAVVVLFSAALGVWVERRTPSLRRQFVLRNAAVASVISAVFVAIGSAMSYGAIGPERMGAVGPHAATMFGFTLLLVGIPFVNASLLAHPNTVTQVNAKIQEHKERSAQKAAEKSEDTDADASESGIELGESEQTAIDEQNRDIEQADDAEDTK